jgi:hypothetical protein
MKNKPSHLHRCPWLSQHCLTEPVAPQLVKRPQAQSMEYGTIDGRELPPGSTAISGTSKSRLLSDWLAFRELYRVAHR